MSIFYGIMFAGLGLGAFVITLKAALSTSFFDRALMVNAFTSYAIALTVVVGLSSGTDFYIDGAIVFALIGFISMVAALRYVRHRCTGSPNEEKGTDV